jgi:hypothetical protein
LQRPFEPARAKIILPAFHERRLELEGQHLLENRDVFVEKLFLQIDRVGGNDRLLFLLDRVEDRRRQIRDRLPYPRSRLHHQMAFLLERPRHGHGHLLLLGPILEILRPREQAFLGKKRAHLFDEVALQRVS